MTLPAPASALAPGARGAGAGRQPPYQSQWQQPDANVTEGKRGSFASCLLEQREETLEQAPCPGDKCLHNKETAHPQTKLFPHKR